MEDCFNRLAVAVRSARKDQKYTQTKLAEIADLGSRTIINMESGDKDTMFSSVYAIVRVLNLNPMQVFFPEVEQDRPNLQRLQLLIEGCSEQEAADLIKIVETVLEVLKSKEKADLK